MMHHLGGPYRMVEAFKNGNALFIAWPLNGLIQIVRSTGALWDNRKAPWSMHREDLQRVTTGFVSYDMRAKILPSFKSSPKPQS